MKKPKKYQYLNSKGANKIYLPDLWEGLVSRITSGHIQPMNCSFPNFTSHPNDKNCSKYLTSQDKTPK